MGSVKGDATHSMARQGAVNSSWHVLSLVSEMQLALGFNEALEHSGLGSKVELERENNPGAHRLSLPPVPTVQYAGKDGFPELPMLEALAGSFLKAEPNSNSDTKTFIGKLQKIGKNEVEKLQHLKSAYDRKLKSQERKSTKCQEECWPCKGDSCTEQGN